MVAKVGFMVVKNRFSTVEGRTWRRVEDEILKRIARGFEAVERGSLLIGGFYEFIKQNKQLRTPL